MSARVPVLGIRFRVAAAVLAVALAAAARPAAAQVASQAAAPRVFDWVEVITAAQKDPVHAPVAVAAATPSEVVVADGEAGALYVYRHDVGPWTVDETVQLPAPPYDLAWDGTRYVVSLRDGGGVMAAEGPRLQLRRLPLPSGVVPGALAPTGDGGLLVQDLASDTVLRLDASNAVAGRFDPGVRITDVAAAPNGGYYAAVAPASEVRLYGADGGLRETWKVPGIGPVPAWPGGLAAEPGGAVLLVDRHNHRIVRLDAQGRLAGVGARGGWEPGLLRFPADLARMPDGRIVVADLLNGRAQLYAPVAGEAP